MKRILPSLLFLLAISSTSRGQSITRASFARPAAFTDTLYRAIPSSISVAAQGTNQTWDYSGLTPTGGAITIVHYDAVDSASNYPGAYQFSDGDLDSPTGQTFPASEFLSINPNGYHVCGYYVSGLNESLTAVTGGANDVLDIPFQRLVFPDTMFYLKFPVTAQSAWSGEYNRNVQFNLTVASAGLSASPGYFQFKVEQTRTVVGSGQIIIPDENGNAMTPVDVLMIEVDEVQTDSVFLGGAPAPPSLMAAFGLVQGATETKSFVVFYPLNNGANPVASYTLDPNGNPNGFEYRPDEARRASNISLNEMELNSTSLYPNPLKKGESLQIDFEGAANVKTVKVYDTQGQQVAEFIIDDAHKELSFSPDLDPGIYLVSLVNAYGKEVSRTKLQAL